MFGWGHIVRDLPNIREATFQNCFCVRRGQKTNAKILEEEEDNKIRPYSN
jgi:hypothetical protein